MRKPLAETGLAGLPLLFLTSRKWLTLLCLLGITLGLALLTAVTTFRQSFGAAILAEIREYHGTYSISARTHDDSLFTPEALRKASELSNTRYSVEVLHLRRLPVAGEPMDAIGVGPFPENEFAYGLREGHYPGPGEFAVKPDLAKALGLQVGDTLQLDLGSGPQTVRLSGIRTINGYLPGEDGPSMLFDLDWLRTQTGRTGQANMLLLDYIGHRGGAQYSQLFIELRRLHPDLTITSNVAHEEPLARARTMARWAEIYGIVAAVTALFLIAGTMSTVVQERAREWAMLRAIGASTRQVVRLIRWEALIYTLSAGPLGIVMGLLSVTLALRLSFDHVITVTPRLVIPWPTLFLQWILVIGATLLAAYRPAKAAGSVPPFQAMRTDHCMTAKSETAGGLLGLLLLLAGFSVVFFMDRGSMRIRELGGLLLISALLVELRTLLPRIVTLLAKPLGYLIPADAQLAVNALTYHRERSVLTATTLFIGIAFLTSMGTVLATRDGFVEEAKAAWYVADASVHVSIENGHLGRALREEVAAVPGVTNVAALGQYIFGGLAQYDYENRADPEWMKLTSLNTGAMEIPPWNRMEWFAIDARDWHDIYGWKVVEGDISQEGLIFTQEAARVRGIRVGETLGFASLHEVQTAVDRQSAVRYAPVVAIVEEMPPYWHRASFAVSRSLLTHMNDHTIYFNYDPAQREQVLQSVQWLLRHSHYDHAQLRDLNRELESHVEQMKQMWAILWATGTVILVISALSLVNSVVSGLRQRRRELAIIRAVGSSPLQTTRQIVIENALLGLASSILGLVAGRLFAWAYYDLVLAGQGDKTVIPLHLYFVFLACGPVLAVLAGILPAMSMSRGPVNRVIGQE